MKQTLFLAASTLATAFSNGEHMKLINTKTGCVIVEFKNGKAEFFDLFLKDEMKETGILIPPSLAQNYENKEVIFLGDPLFEKAFMEVYYPVCISHSVYQWRSL